MMVLSVLLQIYPLKHEYHDIFITQYLTKIWEVSEIHEKPVFAKMNIREVFENNHIVKINVREIFFFVRFSHLVSMLSTGTFS